MFLERNSGTEPGRVSDTAAYGRFGGTRLGKGLATYYRSASRRWVPESRGSPAPRQGSRRGPRGHYRWSARFAEEADQRLAAQRRSRSGCRQNLENTRFRARREPSEALGLSPACVPAAKPGRLSSAISGSIATARRICPSFGRLNGLWIASLQRTPVG